MHLRLIFVFLLGFLFIGISCKSPSEKKNEGQSQALPSFESNDTTFIWSYQGCNPDSGYCTYIRYRYPIFSQNEPLNKLTLSLLSPWDVESRSNTNQKDAGSLCADFKGEYESFILETGNIFKETWYFDQDVCISAQKGQILCMNVWTEEFSGGAHGMLTRDLMWVDMTSNSSISTDSLFQNQRDSSLLQLIEQEFRALVAIDAQTPWEEAGFSFKNETFQLPSTIGLTDQGVVFYYSKYEVAPYAMGDIEIIIPLEKVLPYFSLGVKQKLEFEPFL